MSDKPILVSNRAVNKWNKLVKKKSDRNTAVYKICRNVILGECVKEFGHDTAIIRNWDMYYFMQNGIIKNIWRNPKRKLVRVDTELKKQFDLMYKDIFINNKQYQ